MKKETVFLILAGVIGLPTWVYLFVTDWKMGLIIFLLMFSNNLSMKSKE